MSVHIIGSVESSQNNRVVGRITTLPVSEAILQKSAPGVHTLLSSGGTLDVEFLASILLAGDRPEDIHALGAILMDSSTMRSILAKLILNDGRIQPDTQLFSDASLRQAVYSATRDNYTPGQRTFLIELLTALLTSAKLMLPVTPQMYPIQRTVEVPDRAMLLAEADRFELTRILSELDVRAPIEAKRIHSSVLTERMTEALQRVGRAMLSAGRMREQMISALQLVRGFLLNSEEYQEHADALSVTPALLNLASNLTVVQAALEVSVVNPVKPYNYASALTKAYQVLKESQRYEVVPLSHIRSLLTHRQVFGVRDKLKGVVIGRNLSVGPMPGVMSLITRQSDTGLYEVQPSKEASATLDLFVGSAVKDINLSDTVRYSASILSEMLSNTSLGALALTVGLVDDEANYRVLMHYAASLSQRMMLLIKEDDTGDVGELGFELDVAAINYESATPVLGGMLQTLDPFEAILLAVDNVPAGSANPAGQTLPLSKGAAMAVMDEELERRLFKTTLSDTLVPTVSLGGESYTLKHFSVANLLTLHVTPVMRLFAPRVGRRVLAAHIDAVRELLTLLDNGVAINGAIDDVSPEGNFDYASFIQIDAGSAKLLKHQVGLMLDVALSTVYTKSTMDTLVRAQKSALLAELPREQRSVLYSRLQELTVTTQLKLWLTLQLLMGAGLLGEEKLAIVTDLILETDLPFNIATAINR